jgi:hypothetical protein
MHEITASEMMKKKAIEYFFISAYLKGLHYICFEPLNKNGYKILCCEDTEDSFSDDGLIVARDQYYHGSELFKILSTKKKGIEIR